MYSKDFRIRHLLAMFFAIGISHEILVFLKMPVPILSLVYTIGLLIIVFNYSNLKKYLWPPGLGIIGIFSLLYFLFLAIGYMGDLFREISSVVTILVWLKCIEYLNNDSDNNYYGEDENIKTI